MLDLKPSCLAPLLKAVVPRAARTATCALQATLITMGLAGAGELLGILPLWLQGLVSGTAAVESDARAPGKEGLNRRGAETPKKSMDFQSSAPHGLSGEPGAESGQENGIKASSPLRRRGAEN